MTKSVSRKQSRTSVAHSRLGSWYYGLLARYGYAPAAIAVKSGSKKRSRTTPLISYIPNDLDQMIKLATIVLVGASFMYGYFVNKTVSITTDYSKIEQNLDEAENRLVNVSTQIAKVESELELIQDSKSVLVQSEPAGFVSRDILTGFTYDGGREG